MTRKMFVSLEEGLSFVLLGIKMAMLMLHISFGK